MSTLTLKKIRDYIKETSTEKTFAVNIGDLSINIKKDLSIVETQEFVEAVVSGAYIDSIIPSDINIDVMFAVTFLQDCTDVPLPLKKNDEGSVIDGEEAYLIAKSLNLHNLWQDDEYSQYNLPQRLRYYVDKRIEFENAKLISYASAISASEDAIEAVAAVAYKGVDVMSKLCDVLDNLKGLTQDGKAKILKYFTSKKLDGLFDKLQSAIQGAIPKSESNTEVVE